MEMTYVGGLAGWIHKGEPSRYVGGMAGGVYENTGRHRFVGGSVGRIHEPEPRLYLGGMVGWVPARPPLARHRRPATRSSASYFGLKNPRVGLGL